MVEPNRIYYYWW